MKTTTLVIILAFFTLAACNKGKREEGQGKGTAAAEAAKPAEPAGPKVLDKLGIKAALPEGAEISDMMGDVMVQGPNLAVMIGLAKDTSPKTLEDGQAAAEAFVPKADQKTETLSDGWVITYENTGSAGKNYFVNARRDIGGKGYECSTTGSTPEQQANAVAFCKSLQP